MVAQLNAVHSKNNRFGYALPVLGLKLGGSAYFDNFS